MDIDADVQRRGQKGVYTGIDTEFTDTGIIWNIGMDRHTDSVKSLIICSNTDSEKRTDMTIDEYDKNSENEIGIKIWPQ